jgi:hypothetical protein
MRAFADVSIHGQLSSAANSLPSSRLTARSLSRSSLLPTTTIGTLSASLTRKICSLNDEISSNEPLFVIL